MSERTEIRCKFGRNRRFVLILEWLTLCPTWTPLPVIPHLRAIPTSTNHRHKYTTRGSFEGRALLRLRFWVAFGQADMSASNRAFASLADK